MKHFGLVIFLIAAGGLSGCQAGGAVITPAPTSIGVPAQPSATTALSPTTTRTATEVTPIPEITYWFDDSIPAAVQMWVCFPPNIHTAPSRSQATVVLSRSGGELAYRRIYGLAGRFDLLVDGLSLADVKAAWQGSGPWKLGMSRETYEVFAVDWGETSGVLLINEPAELARQVWREPSLLVLLPFEEIVPQLKVLRVDGKSVLDKELDVTIYPLRADYFWQGEDGILGQISASCRVGSNRNPDLMTDVLLTGVSALTRGTAARMAEEGILYPAGDILAWLQSADITHISHEVPFYEDCPAPLPIRAGGRFCAQPEFMELFTYAGVDVVELTGNHLNDWGRKAFAGSLQMYEQAGLQVFGGGMNTEAARQPLLIEHHGNRLAFLGCNATGPESDWATETEPGSAPCDLEWLAVEVQRLRSEGFLPIVTFQGFEVCDYRPHSSQRVLADRMVEAGAVVVSGSQAHCPQAYRLEDETFIHYGLGNFWFDQVDWITKQELLDRYIFYDGRHLSTEVLTAWLEEGARPRPMQPEERKIILEKVFNASEW